MVKNNISRIRRRKQEREAALKDFTELAADLNLEILDMRGVKPETFPDAIELLMEARASLRDNPNIVVQSMSPVTGVYLTLANANPTNPEMYIPESCPRCGNPMMEHIQTMGSIGFTTPIESWEHVCLKCGFSMPAAAAQEQEQSDKPGSEYIN